MDAPREVLHLGLDVPLEDGLQLVLGPRAGGEPTKHLLIPDQVVASDGHAAGSTAGSPASTANLVFPIVKVTMWS
jgi:hypothetical protein